MTTTAITSPEMGLQVPTRPVLQLERPDFEPYYAEPLDPWRLQTSTGESYYSRTLRLIGEVIEPHRTHAEELARQNNGNDDVELPRNLVDTVHTALVMLLTKRCDQNDRAYQKHLMFVADGWLTKCERRLIYKARVGSATPVEQMQLREMELGLGAGPVTKWSHPWDNKAASKLEDVMKETVTEFDESAIWLDDEDTDLRYHVNRTNDSEETGGIFVVRKRNVALCGLSTLVVERRSFLLRLDTELPEGLQDITDLLASRQPDVNPEALYPRPQKLTRAQKRERRNIMRNKVQPRLQLLNAGQFVPLSLDRMSQTIAASSYAFERAVLDEHPSVVQLATSYYGRGIESASSSARKSDYYTARMGAAALAA